MQNSVIERLSGLQDFPITCGPAFDVEHLALGERAYLRLRFRLAVAISTFQIAEWQDALGREGLHLPSRFIDGYYFRAFDMCEQDREWHRVEAAKRKDSARHAVAKFIPSELIRLIEMYGTENSNSAYMCAWHLMAAFVHIFDPFYAAMFRELAATPDEGQVIPDLEFIMNRQRELSPDWCPSEPRSLAMQPLQ